jgi:Transglutaminase-like superfamily
MPNRYRLRVQIDEDQPPTGAAGLLVPLPPTTPHQEMMRVAIDPTWSATHCAAQGGVQLALFASFPSRSLGSPIEFEMLDSGHLIEEQFSPTGSEPGEDVKQVFSDLHLDTDQDQALLRIVECISQKFNYQSDFRNDTPLTCDIVTGNCLSINAALIGLARLSNIKTAYYMGYFFEDGRRRTLAIDDRHCWVSTLTPGGYESWDIAHRLKRGLRSAGPALNPIPGVRFAMSVGRDLVFDLPVTRLEVGHLCEPRWVFPENRSQRCQVRVTADPVSTQ